MSGYIVHKAVNLDKVKVARRKVLEAPGFLDQNYMGQAKYDGCSAVFVLTVGAGEDQVLSRTAERVRSLEWMLPHLHRLFSEQVMEHGGVTVLGEAWAKELSFAEISGKFRQHAPSCDLGLRVFDVLTAEEWEAGKSDVPYISRFARVAKPLYSSSQADINAATTHFTPRTTRFEDWQGWCNFLVDKGGYDGLILRDPNGGWQVGSGTGGEIIKLKRVLSFDLRVTGVEEGKGKHAGRLGAIVVDFQGKELRVGTGFTDAQREEWWTKGGGERTDIVGLIAEIEAMDYSEDGLLREPRFKGLRFDKLETD